MITPEEYASLSTLIGLPKDWGTIGIRSVDVKRQLAEAFDDTTDPLVEIARTMVGRRRVTGYEVVIVFEKWAEFTSIDFFRSRGVQVVVGGTADEAKPPKPPPAVPMGELRFTIPGEPVAKERLRHRVVVPRGGAKPFASGYTGGATVAYEKAVGLAAQIAVTKARWSWSDDDRFTVLLKIFRRYEGKGGDLDNYVKSIWDGMNGITWPDDARVRQLGTVLVGPSAKPRVEVTIRRHRRGERATG